MQTCLMIITAIGSLGTLIGALMIYNTLKADHDWRRRKHAIDILGKWNDYTADHAKAIEEIFPHIRDVDIRTGCRSELTRDQAKIIYTCNPDDKKNWGLRFHIVELLNHLEGITTAYNHKVADCEIIHKAMKDAMTVWITILKNFLDVVAECEGFQPWQPLIDTIDKWKIQINNGRKQTA